MGREGGGGLDTAKATLHSERWLHNESFRICCDVHMSEQGMKINSRVQIYYYVSLWFIEVSHCSSW